MTVEKDDSHARSARSELRRHHRRRRPPRPGARLVSGRSAASTSCWSTAACNTAARWSPRRSTAPGFYHNLHSINHFHISETPWFKDLEPRRPRQYITPRYEFGQPHLDGSALIFGRDLEETLANVARFSKKDAQTFRDWNRKAEEITAKIFLPERFSDPLPQAEREALLSQERHRPRLPGGDQAAAVRHGEGAVRERARPAPVPVQDFAVRHLAGRHAVEDEPDGLGDPRLRPAERLPALQGRLGQSRPRAVRDLHRRRRALRAAGRARPASSSRAARRPASR